MSRKLGGRALLYLRTARHMRWRQWLYRPIRAVQRRIPVRCAGTGSVDEASATVMAAAIESWTRCESFASAARARSVCCGEFSFTNRTQRLERIDWRRTYVSPLWTYNLHYFDYARDLAGIFRMSGDQTFARRFEQLADDWISQTGGGSGPGWEPYPLSVRAVNWTYALLLFGSTLSAAFRARLADSLYCQFGFLYRRLEWPLLGNHLHKNLHALMLGGLLFAGSEAARWRRRAAQALRREVAEQVLPDGGHVERAPMYHAIALADFLELTALGRAVGDPSVEAYVEPVQRMVSAFGAFSRPDGSLHLLNDSANGVAPSRERLRALARSTLEMELRDPVGPWALPDSGFFGFTDASSNERFIIDCGAPGPSYQPGHAHCGLLSFELDLHGRPVVVDSGVSGYDGDRLRTYTRGTRAHNTVLLAGREQSEIWATFRVARRARVIGAKLECGADFRFRGGYKPYHDRRAVHWRTVSRCSGEWLIADCIEGSDALPAQSFLHFHPDCTVTSDGGHFVVTAAGARVMVEPFGMATVDVVSGQADPPQGWYCPEFGRAVPAPALVCDVAEDSRKHFGFRVRPLERNA